METALPDVLDGFYTAADNKQVTVLIGLDLSAAFNSVDHEVLLQRPQLEFGVTAIPLTWIHSYLDTVYAKPGQHQSPAVRFPGRHPPGVCSRSPIVCGILQPSG